MDNELARELIESTNLLTESVKLQHQLIQDQLLPCFSIMSVLVQGLPPEQQNTLLTRLKEVAEKIEPLATSENIESSYAKAVKMVSALMPGNDFEPPEEKLFKLIHGGKKNL